MTRDDMDFINECFRSWRPALVARMAQKMAATDPWANVFVQNYIPIPPAIGKEEHPEPKPGMIPGWGFAGEFESASPEPKPTSVIDDFEAIGKRLKEIQAEKDRE